MTTFTLIGAGHVGRVLGRLLVQQAGWQLQQVLTRSATSAAQAVEFIGSGSAIADYAALAPAEVFILAVGDDQIVPASTALAQAQTDRLAGSVVFHCSGALASDRLQTVRAAGASVASVHPIRSFADPQAVAQAFAGTYCGIEGDAAALALLTPAFAAIGAQPVPIDAAAKTVYHAAAVFASNYLVTVLDAALRAYQAAGIPEAVARQLVQPLASESMANVFRLGAATALSGPIARGDMATVERQLQAVRAWDAPSGELYQSLIAPTTALAQRKQAAIKHK